MTPANELAQVLRAANATDLHLVPGRQPRVRTVDGDCVALDVDVCPARLQMLMVAADTEQEASSKPRGARTVSV